MEKDLKILEEFLEAYKIAEEVLDGEVIQAIENLIARYKKLEYENKTLKSFTSSIFNDSFEKDYILKSKVKEKIKVYEKLSEENVKNKDNMDFEECFNKQCLYTRLIWLLQELLD